MLQDFVLSFNGRKATRSPESGVLAPWQRRRTTLPLSLNNLRCQTMFVPSSVRISECRWSPGMLIGEQVCSHPRTDSFVYWSTGGHICISFTCHCPLKRRLSSWSLQERGLCMCRIVPGWSDCWYGNGVPTSSYVVVKCVNVQRRRRHVLKTIWNLIVETWEMVDFQKVLPFRSSCNFPVAVRIEADVLPEWLALKGFPWHSGSWVWSPNKMIPPQYYGWAQ